jgi:hypothetical protein
MGKRKDKETKLVQSYMFWFMTICISSPVKVSRSCEGEHISSAKQETSM